MFLEFQHTLRALANQVDTPDISESFPGDIQDLLESLFAEAVHEVGKPVSRMGKDDKVAIVSFLDNKGAFQVKKAVPFVASCLHESRITIYNYLNEVRSTVALRCRSSTP